MSNTHDITGVGPIQVNGTTILFTVKAAPYYASAAQVATFGRSPVPGDQLTDNLDGTVTLISNPGTPVPEQPQEDLINDGNTNMGEMNNI